MGGHHIGITKKFSIQITASRDLYTYLTRPRRRLVPFNSDDEEGNLCRVVCHSIRPFFSCDKRASRPRKISS